MLNTDKSKYNYKYLYRYGACWIIQEITPEKNEGFCWEKVVATWSGLGPRPLYADEPRTFLLGRRNILGGEYA